MALISGFRLPLEEDLPTILTKSLIPFLSLHVYVSIFLHATISSVLVISLVFCFLVTNYIRDHFPITVMFVIFMISVCFIELFISITALMVNGSYSVHRSTTKVLHHIPETPM